MTKTEKLILKKLITSLNESTTTKWQRGSLEDWSDWAAKMKNTINNSTAILDALVSDENPEQENQ